MHLQFWLGNSHLEDWEGARWIHLMGDGTSSGLDPTEDFGVCGFESLGPVTRVVDNQHKDSRFCRLKAMYFITSCQTSTDHTNCMFVDILCHSVFI
jgi:hypothetical protein